ncbi:MAG: hypothetical protein ACR2HX_17900 [Pyrinomonadaceae bacterium]
MTDSIPREWLEEFEAAARRPLKTRLNYSFIKTPISPLWMTLHTVRLTRWRTIVVGVRRICRDG